MIFLARDDTFRELPFSWSASVTRFGIPTPNLDGSIRINLYLPHICPYPLEFEWVVYGPDNAYNLQYPRHLKDLWWLAKMSILYIFQWFH